MGLWILGLVAWPVVAAAGIIHGIVLERASSQPLARTRVELVRLGRGGENRVVGTAVTNLAGQYWFASLGDGQYVVKARRAGFADVAYGEKRALGPGAVVVVEGDSATFAELRMTRLGGITGKVVDENEVGLAGIPVHAYKAELPLRIAATGKTDDRGVYRLGAMMPGMYWVRTGAMEVEDGGSFLPTFHPGVMGTKDAKVVTVGLEGDAPQMNLRAQPGRLFSVRGVVRGCPGDETQARVTLSADTGRKETTTACNGRFEFDQLAPGAYELLIEPARILGTAYWGEMTLEKQTELGEVQMTRMPEVTHRVEGLEAGKRAAAQARVTLRRWDLAGESHKAMAGMPLTPGYWEIWMQPEAGVVWEKVSMVPDFYQWRRRSSERMERLRGDLAPRMVVEMGTQFEVRYGVSVKTGAVAGAVREKGKLMVGAPVYLLAKESGVRQRTHGMRVTVSGEDGQFRFGDLPDGVYWVLSSADLEEVNETVLKDFQAREVEVKGGVAEKVELELVVR